MHPYLKPLSGSSTRLVWALLLGSAAVEALAGEASREEKRGAERADATRRETGSIAGRVQHAITGRYLANARIVVPETALIAFSDEAGVFLLPGVPAGPQVLRVFYTGLDEQTVPVKVPGGGVIEVQVDLTSASLYGVKSDAVTLAPFVVATARETDINAIATNEQRFAPNLKHVVSTGSFGDVTEGNMGEFLKSLPGVSAQYSDAEIISVSARGFGSNTTTVSVDGSQLANANFQGSGRAFTFGTVSINNVSRVELTKVPTPAMPADSLGGSVNMISKSAFERSGRLFRYRLYLDANSDDLSLRPTPHAFEKRTQKVVPGVDFDYTLPLSKNLGVVVTGLVSNHYNPQLVANKQFSATAAGSAASVANPYLQLFQMIDGPRHAHRQSVSGKLDWRVTPHAVLSVGVQASYWFVYFGNNTLGANTGNLGTPSVVGGVPLTFGTDFVSGATGRGSVAMGAGYNTLASATSGENISYRFDNGRWRAQAGVSNSNSRTWFRNTGKGFFSQLNSTMAVPVRVEMRQITGVSPGSIRAFDNANREIPFRDVNNYVLNTAASELRDVRDHVGGADLSLRRQIGLAGVPAGVEAGGRFRTQTRDRKFRTNTWSYAGPDGNLATADSLAPYRSTMFSTRESLFGYRDLPWASPHLAWVAYEANPRLFVQTPAQVVAAETFRVGNSEKIKETVEAGYLQGDVRLFRNRLNVVTGVRFERTRTAGVGPLVDPGLAFVRRANGSFQLDAAGNRIRRPEAGSAGSIEEARVTRFERGAAAGATYDGLYPSLHLTLNLTENLLVRAAYAQTYGRPNFTEIIPNTTITQSVLGEDDYEDPNGIRGTISVRNPALRPWTADNFDVSLEYYTRSGGVFSAGAFRKDLQDFFGTQVRLATPSMLQELGLDPAYAGWNISSRFNAGDARVDGFEVNLRQSLQVVAPWLRPFTVFANGTKLELQGNRDADFSDFIPKTANWGFTFAWTPVTIMARWNHRGQQRGAAFPALGPDAYIFPEARTQLDLNLDLQIRRSLSLFASARNALNQPQEIRRYGSLTPAAAQLSRSAEYGVQLSLGVKGTF
jgi:iron complex outermembrane receptor protein